LRLLNEGVPTFLHTIINQLLTGMKTILPVRFCPRQLWLLLLVGLAWSANAQNHQISLADSVVLFRPTTLVKWRPLALARSSVNLALEQTVGSRGSFGLEGYHTIGLIPAFKIIGTLYGGGLSYRYYPLNKQTAPADFYVGPRISYDYLANNSLLSLLSLLTFSDKVDKISLRTLGPMVGYQHCSRSSGLVFDAQGSMGLLYNMRYHLSDRIGRTRVEHTTRVQPILARVYLSVGYRFGSRRNRPMQTLSE
jgi:hypothetical protein